MKRLFLLLALVGMIATSCEDSGIEEPSNPTEQPDDNTDEEQPCDDENTDEEQPGGDDNTDEEQPGGDDNTDEEQPGGDDNTGEEQPGGDENKDDEEHANPDEIIKFVDNTAKTICIVNWDTNGDAELSISEAVAVTDIGTIFQSKDIMAFDEFKYFTGVTTIVNGAFKYCANLVKISIPDSVTSIGDEAFYRCDRLTSVTIPDSVTTIGDDAFADCYSLTEFNGKFASEDGRCLIINGTLNSFARYGLTEYTIPDSVTTIGDSALAHCSSLTSVTIPDSVTTIGNSAFSGCDSLTSVTIPDSVTTIGSQAFYGCNSLTSVTIGDGVTSIGDYAFSVYYSLTSVYCKATTPPSLGGTYVFYGIGSGCKIYVPTGSVNAYKSDWSAYAYAIVGYDF